MAWILRMGQVKHSVSRGLGSRCLRHATIFCFLFALSPIVDATGQDASRSTIGFVRLGQAIRKDADKAPISSGLETTGNHTGPVLDGALSPDGKYAVTCSSDGTTRIWEAGTGKELNRIPSLKQEWAFGCQFHPTSNRIFVNETRRVFVADVPSGEIIWSRRFGEMADVPYHALALSPDGSKFAMVVEDGVVDICECEKFKKVARIVSKAFRDRKDGSPERELQVIRLLKFSPSGKKIAIGSRSDMAASSRLEIWDVGKRRHEFTLRPNKANIYQVEFIPMSRTMVAVGHCRVKGFKTDGTDISSPSLLDSVVAWDLDRKKAVSSYAKVKLPFAAPDRSVPTSYRTVYDVALLNKEVFATAENSGLINLYQLNREGLPVKTLNGHFASVHGIDYSPKSQKLLSVSRDQSAIIWDLRRPEFKRLHDLGR